MAGILAHIILETKLLYKIIDIQHFQLLILVIEVSFLLMHSYEAVQQFLSSLYHWAWQEEG